MLKSTDQLLYGLKFNLGRLIKNVIHVYYKKNVYKYRMLKSMGWYTVRKNYAKLYKKEKIASKL